MVSFEDFKELDIRVAEIIEVKEHPNADKLYVLTIAIGEETRQIVAGIRFSYGTDELKGKKVIVIRNLAPMTIRGEESNGMLLAAGSDNGPVLLIPEKDVISGAKIS